jgi:hypothetical protein
MFGFRSAASTDDTNENNINAKPTVLAPIRMTISKRLRLHELHAVETIPMI